MEMAPYKFQLLLLLLFSVGCEPPLGRVCWKGSLLASRHNLVTEVGRLKAKNVHFFDKSVKIGTGVV